MREKLLGTLVTERLVNPAPTMQWSEACNLRLQGIEECVCVCVFKTAYVEENKTKERRVIFKLMHINVCRNTGVCQQ